MPCCVGMSCFALSCLVVSCLLFSRVVLPFLIYQILHCLVSHWRALSCRAVLRGLVSSSCVVSWRVLMSCRASPCRFGLVASCCIVLSCRAVLARRVASCRVISSCCLTALLSCRGVSCCQFVLSRWFVWMSWNLVYLRVLACPAFSRRLVPCLAVLSWLAYHAAPGCRALSCLEL